MLGAVLGERPREIAGIVVAERHNPRARQSRAGPHAGMGQLVQQDEVAAPGQGRGDAEIGEIAAAEDQGGLGALVPREPRLQRAEMRGDGW